MGLYIELRERDYQILATLMLLRMCSASHLSALYFTSTRSTWVKLKALKDQELIVAEKVYMPDGEKWFYVYFLTKSGAKKARYWLERYYDRIVPDVNLVISKRLFQHELLIIDVFVKLVIEKQLSVDDLFSGKFLDSRLAPVLPCVFNKRQVLKPDARFELNGVYVWVEIDRQTERTSVIDGKLQSYQQYFSSNPGDRHTILFLVDGAMNWKRFRDIRVLSRKYIGPHEGGGKINWYTLKFDDLDFVVNRLITKDFFWSCIRELKAIGMYKQSVASRSLIFNSGFLSTASMPACWLGFKDDESDYEQFYIVESIIGGESGGLQRLEYFGAQYSAYYNTFIGHKIKLIVLYKDKEEIEVVAKIHPKLIDKAIYVCVSDLLNGTSNVLLGREE